MTGMTDLLKSRNSWVFDLDGTLTLPMHDFAFIRHELAIPDGSDILEHLGTLLPEEAALRHLPIVCAGRMLVTS
jgi:hypothetical protein